MTPTILPSLRLDVKLRALPAIWRTKPAHGEEWSQVSHRNRMARFPNFLYLKVTHSSVICDGFVWSFQLPATESSPADRMTLLKRGPGKTVPGQWGHRLPRLTHCTSGHGHALRDWLSDGVTHHTFITQGSWRQLSPSGFFFFFFCLHKFYLCVNKIPKNLFFPLVPWPGMEPAPCLGKQILNHWAIREVPHHSLLNYTKPTIPYALC